MITVQHPSLSGLDRFLSKVVECSKRGKTLLLTPSSALRSELERRLHTNHGDYCGIETATLLGTAVALSGLEPASSLHLQAIINSVLNKNADLYHRAFSTSISISISASFLRLFNALRAAGYDADMLRRTAKDSGYSDIETSTIASIYADYCSELSRLSLADETEIFDAATEALSTFGLSHKFVFVVGFYSLTQSQAKFISSLRTKFEGCFYVFVELCPESVDADSETEVLRNAASSELCGSLFTALDKQNAIISGFECESRAKLEFYQCKSLEEEVRNAAEWAARKLSEGVNAGDIAVLFADYDIHESLTKSYFSRINAPYDMLRDSNTAKLPIAQAISRMIDLLSPKCTQFELQQFFSSPCLNLPPAVKVLCKNIAIAAGLRRGNPPHSVWLMQLEDLRKRVVEQLPNGHFEMLRARFDSNAVLTALDVLTGLLSDIIVTLNDKGGFPLALDSILRKYLIKTEESERLLVSLMQTTKELVQSEVHIEPSDAAKFAFGAMSSPSFSAPSCDGIAIAPILLGRNLLRSHIYIGGLTDDAFPYRSSFLPFLPRLQKHGIGAINRAVESRHLYYLLTRRATHVALSYPQMQGFRSYSPSFYFYLEKEKEVNDTQSEFAHNPQSGLSSAWECAGKISRHAPLSDNWRGAISDYLSRFPSHKAALSAAEAETLRIRTTSCAYSGIIDVNNSNAATVLSKTIKRRISVSKFEEYVNCPLRFFFSSVVGLREEVAEDDALLDPRDRGSILHNVLSRFYIAWRLEYGDTPVSASINDAEAKMMSVVRDVYGELQAISAQPFVLMWLSNFVRNGRVRGVLGAFLRYEFSRGMPVPIAVETDIELAVSSAGRLRGRIDRIDIDADGAPAVIDYKTGMPPTFTKISSGSSLQLPIYSAMLMQKRNCDFVRFYHYKLGKKVGRTAPANDPDEFMKKAIANAKDVSERVMHHMGKGIFNRSLKDDHSKLCPYASLCRRLCDHSLTPVPNDEETRGLFCVSAAMEEEE